MDPFATLGLPRRYDVDKVELDRRYRELQQTLHPDKHASAPASERALTLRKAIEVNEAYRVLRDDQKRAEDARKGSAAAIPAANTAGASAPSFRIVNAFFVLPT